MLGFRDGHGGIEIVQIGLHMGPAAGGQIKQERFGARFLGSAACILQDLCAFPNGEGLALQRDALLVLNGAGIDAFHTLRLPFDKGKDAGS